MSDISQIVRSEEFRNYATNLLRDLCAIDTTPNSDVAIMRKAEAGCFDIIERELAGILPGLRLERRPVNPAIETHPAYTPPHFTKTADRPKGLPAKATYKNRGNLVCVVPGSAPQAPGINLALNAHVDVIAPFIPPKLENGILYGRGTCDDKGGVVAIMAALKLVSRLVAEKRLEVAKNIVAMFVIEEETGGNGSLSLATDKEIKQLYDAIFVIECCENRIYPANRGAVWYKAELDGAGMPLLEAAAFAIEELEKEGRSIKTESHHPLFPQRPVQTCHGIIGPFGQHPSRICGEVSFLVHPERAAAHPAAFEVLVRDCVESALAEYVGVYGDKTKAIDATTGKPKVDHHYDLAASEDDYRIDIHGSTGHMGSILENDGSITKMSGMIRALCRSKTALEKAADCAVSIRLAGHADENRLVLEGGQGFVPTHPIEAVMERMRRAAARGVDTYLKHYAPAKAKAKITVTYNKLHNAAFDGDPDSPAMRAAVETAKRCGTWKDEPIRGWTVSCDARLFATEYPGMPVLTSGPGLLAHAHADHEQLKIDELIAFAEFLALYIERLCCRAI